jgi:uncharacterized protein
MQAPSLSKQRSRRLRKKLRVAEFQELGFQIEFKFPEGMNPDDQSELFMGFIENVIEGRSLNFGGGEESGFVTRSSRGSATEEDRQAVKTWLEATGVVHSVTVGALQDAWYGADWD